MPPAREQLVRKHRKRKLVLLVVSLVGIIGWSMFLRYSNANYRDMSWGAIAAHWAIGILYLVIFFRVASATEDVELDIAEYDTQQPGDEKTS